MGGLAGALFFPTSSTHIGNQSPHIGSLASLIPMSYGSEAKSPKGSVNGTAASSFGKDLLGQGFDRRTCFQALNHLKLYRMAFTANYCRILQILTVRIPKSSTELNLDCTETSSEC